MFRRYIPFVPAFLLALNVFPPAIQAGEQPLPLNHVWRGVILCTDGPRGFTLLTPATANGPLYIIELGPRKKDGGNGKSGLAVAHVKPDPRGIALAIDRVVAPASNMPKLVGGHYLPATGKFYGGVSDALDGSRPANAECDYLEANLATDQASQDHLRMASADPQGYLREMAGAISAPPEKEPTSKDWASLAFGVVVIALLFGQASGRCFRPRKSGLQFSAPRSVHTYTQHDGDGWSGRSVGGDIHGNAWQGTGSGPGLGSDVHGNH